MKKKFSKCKRHPVTLIEMMVVMFLIALITGVVAFNYRGSLEKGKVFKTEANISKLQDILSIELASNPSASLNQDWQALVRRSPLVKNAEETIRDGWGEYLQVHIDGDRIVVTSTKYDEYKNTHQ